MQNHTDILTTTPEGLWLWLQIWKCADRTDRSPLLSACVHSSVSDQGHSHVSQNQDAERPPVSPGAVHRLQSDGKRGGKLLRRINRPVYLLDLSIFIVNRQTRSSEKGAGRRKNLAETSLFLNKTRFCGRMHLMNSQCHRVNSEYNLFFFF